MEQLKELAGNPNTWKTWQREAEIPSDRIMPFLLPWWRRRNVRQDKIFFDFTNRVAGYKYLKRAVLALANEEGDERSFFEEAMNRAAKIEQIQ